MSLLDDRGRRWMWVLPVFFVATFLAASALFAALDSQPQRDIRDRSSSEPVPVPIPPRSVP